MYARPPSLKVKLADRSIAAPKSAYEVERSGGIATMIDRCLDRDNGRGVRSTLKEANRSRRNERGSVLIERKNAAVAKLSERVRSLSSKEGFPSNKPDETT